ncbi:MAG: flagellar hook-associated protein 3 FlgL [Verrucomicrobiota bacterium]|jgi:flagellar hook-associated protein 3 FlgL
MRVTANTFPNSLVTQLNDLALRQNRLQNQAATGQRIHAPEDDPSGTHRVLELQDEARSVAQYGRNIGTLREQAQGTYEVLRGLKQVSDRAGELAILADGTKSPEDLRNYATEVTELIKRAAGLANTKFRGNYFLGGTRSDQPPFVSTLNANREVTAVVYQGNQSVSENEIAEGVTMSAQSIGANTSGSGPRGMLTDSRFGADFFNHLISLQNHLLAGDTASIASSDRAGLAADEENLLVHVSGNGVLQSRLDATEATGTLRAASLNALVSKEVDVDLSQVLVRLNQTQTAYQAALQSGAKLLNLSLLDYIR